MSDIATIIIFKKENGEEFIFDDKYVQLTSLENKMLIFRFEAPQDILKEFLYVLSLIREGFANGEVSL